VATADGLTALNSAARARMLAAMTIASRVQ
jgi:hypothetical protein